MKTPAELIQWREGYDVGYIEGGSSEEATLSIMLDDLDLPEGVIAEKDYDTIKNMAKRIKELEKVVDRLEFFTESLIRHSHDDLDNTQDT